MGEEAAAGESTEELLRPQPFQSASRAILVLKTSGPKRREIHGSFEALEGHEMALPPKVGELENNTWADLTFGRV